ncbi:MAG: hypothetical protein FWG40_06260 [Peptococcaceae bacterium]|nr:hypothetical protein [Peptococcaceae bacterium]
MNILYKEKVVYRALEELDAILHAQEVLRFELNVVGGFALMVQQIRMSDYTDIDYVGSPFPDSLREIIDEVGIRYGLGRGWINNDVLLAGSTLEELEELTGQLVFNHAFDLQVITVNVLDKPCLLRMKVIAIDTSFSELEVSGKFARVQDFEDIRLLMETLGCSMNDVVENTFEYVMFPEIFHLIRYYVKTKDRNMFADSKWKRIIAGKGKVE